MATAGPARGGAALAVQRLGWQSMLLLGVATSLDSLAVGVSLALVNVNIWSAAALIGATTAAVSFAGAQIGRRARGRSPKPAQIAGGLLLVTLGASIVAEHLLG